MKTVKRRKLITALIALSLLLCATVISLITTPHEKTFYAGQHSEGKKQIALTFDDGPAENTDELLAGLRERGVKASFFLMGRKVENRAETVEQMYADGHLIGCHTWSHINLFKSGREEIAQELDSTNDLIESITGERPQFFRPPYGYYFPWQLNRIDMMAVLWSGTPRDWENEDADYICSWLVKNVRDGDIILLHDTREATVSAVLEAIDVLLDEGYEFVRADELLCRNGDKLAPGLAYRYCPFQSRAWYI